jgi:PPOX class probable F420-dependent enzyme
VNDAEREEFLAKPQVAVLGTVDAKGRPHGAPVWYLYDDGVFRISTGKGSIKHRNVQANPNISLVIDTKQLPYLAVMVQGEAEIAGPMSDADALRLATRYLGEDVGKRYIEMTASDHDNTVTLTVRPRHVAVYDSRNVGG